VGSLDVSVKPQIHCQGATARHKRTGRLLPRACCLAVTLAMASLLAVMAHEGWPGLHHDAILYVTPAVKSANGEEWNFAIYTPPLLHRPQGDWSWDAHGQLYQAVLLWLMPGGDMSDLMAAMGSLNILTVLALAVYFVVSFSRVAGMGDWGVTAWTVFSLGGSTSILLWLQGRPEHLLPLLLAVGGLAYGLARAPWQRDLVAGIVVGLIAATSPLPGLVAASACLVVLGLGQDRWLQLLRRALGVGGAALVAWYLAILVSCPFSPLEVLRNTIAASAQVPRPRGLSLIIEAWLLNPSFYLVGVPFLGAFVLAVAKACKTPLGLARRVLLGLLASNLLYWVSQSGIIFPGFYYNLLGFYPVVVVWTMRHLAGAQQPSAMLPTVRWVAASILLVATMAASTGVVRNALLLVPYRDAGLTLQMARSYAGEEFARLKPGQRIALPPYHRPCMVVLDDGGWHLVTLAEDLPSLTKVETKLGIEVKVLLWPQTDDGQPPDKLDGFRLTKSYWVPGRPHIWGIPLYSQIPGYQFAVYVRK
jgi:hypothetical protein